MLTSAASADTAWSRSLGYWARWLIHRAPEWWRRSAELLVGGTSEFETRHAVLAGNFDSTELAPDLLGADVDFVNGFARGEPLEAAYPALAAVLWGVVPAEAIQPETWATMFFDTSGANVPCVSCFQTERLTTTNAVRRFAMLRSVAMDPVRTGIHLAFDGRPCGQSRCRGLRTVRVRWGSSRRPTATPISTHHLVDRFIRSIANPDAVVVLEAMCVANLGGDPAMAQFELTSVNEWFQRNGATLPKYAHSGPSCTLRDRLPRKRRLRRRTEPIGQPAAARTRQLRRIRSGRYAKLQPAANHATHASADRVRAWK